MGTLKPPIRWYGGKSKLAPWVISHFPPHRIYVEPFGGAASVLLAKEPAKIEVYNDLHSGVVNFYRVLRDPEKAKELQRRLELTPYSREEFHHCRNGLKEHEPWKYGDVEYAWFFAVVAFQCFGGDISKGGSFGCNGSTATSGGRSKMINAYHQSVKTLTAYASRLLDVEIENSEALSIMGRYDTPETLIYADPPYEDTTGDSSYAHKVDQTVLLEWLNQCKSMVVLSGMHNDLYKEHLSEWGSVELERAIDAGNTPVERTRKTEVLWMNQTCMDARLTVQPELF